jgi:hypothetical protein
VRKAYKDPSVPWHTRAFAALAIKMIPPQILAERREEARGVKDKPVGKVAAVVVVAQWIAALAVWLVTRTF